MLLLLLLLPPAPLRLSIIKPSLLLLSGCLAAEAELEEEEVEVLVLELPAFQRDVGERKVLRRVKKDDM